MGTGSDKKGQDKKCLGERDRKNHKAGRKLQDARLCWYGHVERREEDYVGKKNDGDGDAR